MQPASLGIEKGVPILKNENEVIARACDGDVSAFREIVEAYKKNVYYLARDLCGNHETAEDISQDVFIKVFRSLKKFRGDSKFSSWIHRITLNTFLSQYRKKSNTLLREASDIGDEFVRAQVGESQEKADPEQRAASKMIGMHIERALDRLSPRERTVFVLRHYEHKKQREIADMLNVTVGTVKSTLFRALQRLRSELSFYREELGLEVADDEM
ncbi:sigma-70 family RNA polymerase sigma factor [candidate division KSB1 bacterium]|nr:sigma-70 family RNA polymerase sigma factor [candidate division KSB1 bacterium]